MECVYNNTRNCSDSELSPLKEALQPIQSIMGNTCGHMKLELCKNETIMGVGAVMYGTAMTCDEAGANECLSLFTTSMPLLKGKGADAVCR